MSSIVIAGDTSGSVTLQAPAVAGTTSVNLPSTLGNTSTSAFATTDASGNLGLGVTPSAWSGFTASQVGNTAIWSTSTNNSHFSSNTYYNGTNRIYIGTDYATEYAQQSGQHKWFTAASGTAGGTISATQAMTLDASGNLLVGATSSTGGKFEVTQSANSSVAYINSTNASQTNSIMFVSASRNTTNNSFYYLDCYNATGGTYKLRIADSGNVTNTNNSYGAISDAKLKENIVDASPKLADLMQVQVRNYNLIGETTKQIGVVAQELETVFPAMVDESPDRDAEGNDLGTTTKAVKYSVFVPMLIKAIQEQQALITQLTERITALEAN